MNEALHIRSAEEKDIPMMVSLVGDLFSLDRDFNADPEKQSQGLKLLLQQSQSHILVAERSSQLLGMVTVQILISTASGGYSALVEDMVVLQSERRHSVGDALLNAASDLAKEHDCKRLTLMVDDDNEAAIRFFEKEHCFKTNLSSWWKLLS